MCIKELLKGPKIKISVPGREEELEFHASDVKANWGPHTLPRLEPWGRRIVNVGERVIRLELELPAVLAEAIAGLEYGAQKEVEDSFWRAYGVAICSGCRVKKLKREPCNGVREQIGGADIPKSHLKTMEEQVKGARCKPKRDMTAEF